jgi:SPP1 family predicted phage head-tail adaptor
VRAGKLQYRITIQRPTASGDSYNDQVPSYSTLHTCWAAVLPVESGQGTESEAARQIRGADVSKFVIRYPGASLLPTTKDRILFGTRTYEITQVADVEENHAEAHILAIEIK